LYDAALVGVDAEEGRSQFDRVESANVFVVALVTKRNET